MAEKEKVKETKTSKGSSVGGVAGASLFVLKVVIAFLLVPIVVASTLAIQKEILEFDAGIRHYLGVGMVAYLVLFFFVYDFSHIYQFGQNVMNFCFQFLKPLVNFAPYVIPVYTITVLIVFSILNSLQMTGYSKGVFFALVSATFTMHVVLTARDLYSKDSAPGKPTYFFGMSVVYILDVFVIALIMNMTIPGFEFVRFFQSLAGVTFHIYNSIFSQLF